MDVRPNESVREHDVLIVYDELGVGRKALRDRKTGRMTWEVGPPRPRLGHASFVLILVGWLLVAGWWNLHATGR